MYINLPRGVRRDPEELCPARALFANVFSFLGAGRGRDRRASTRHISPPTSFTRRGRQTRPRGSFDLSDLSFPSPSLTVLQLTLSPIPNILQHPSPKILQLHIPNQHPIVSHIPKPSLSFTSSPSTPYFYIIICPQLPTAHLVPSTASPASYSITSSHTHYFHPPQHLGSFPHYWTLLIQPASCVHV